MAPPMHQDPSTFKIIVIIINFRVFFLNKNIYTFFLKKKDKTNKTTSLSLVSESTAPTTKLEKLRPAEEESRTEGSADRPKGWRSSGWAKKQEDDDDDELCINWFKNEEISSGSWPAVGGVVPYRSAMNLQKIIVFSKTKLKRKRKGQGKGKNKSAEREWFCLI